MLVFTTLFATLIRRLLLYLMLLCFFFSCFCLLVSQDSSETNSVGVPTDRYAGENPKIQYHLSLCPLKTRARLRSVSNLMSSCAIHNLEVVQSLNNKKKEKERLKDGLHPTPPLLHNKAINQ